MKLTLLISALILSAVLGASADTKKTASARQQSPNSPSSVVSSAGGDRKGRFFFLNNLLAGGTAIAKAVLGTEEEEKQSVVAVPVAPPPRPIIILKLKERVQSYPTVPVQPVQPVYPPPPPAYPPPPPAYPKPHPKPDPIPPPPPAQPCPMPMFTSGCPAGHVCAVASPGKHQCVPQHADGGNCMTSFQCMSGRCRGSSCVTDECRSPGMQSSCPKGQECVATSSGNICMKKGTVDECPTTMSMRGCGEMEYCTGGSNGNVCTNKRGVNQACEHSGQCISGSCRHGKCRNDACPMIDTSIDCMPTQYCTSSPQGHMCVSKKESGARCAVSAHCQSGVCEHGACVQDDCWKPFTQDRCQTSHYCSPGTKGHTCEMKRMLGASCRFDVQCKSHMCRHRMCMTDKCSVPLSTDRCDVTTEFCQAGPTGNMCVTKLMDMTSCKVNVQCMSGRCVNGMCMPKTPGKKPIGAACMMHTECETMWCVVGKCSVTQHSVGGRCLVNSDCQSNICGPMMTCQALTTTTPMTTTPTTTTTTTTPTTAAPMTG